MTSLATTEELELWKTKLEDNGCTVKWDTEALTVVAKHQGKDILRAIGKGDGWWIVIWIDSEAVKWKVEYK